MAEETLVPDHEPWVPPIVHPSACITWLASHWGPLGHLDIDPAETYTAVPVPAGTCYVSIRPIERPAETCGCCCSNCSGCLG